MMTNEEAKQMGMPAGIEYREGKFLVINGGYTVTANDEDDNREPPLPPMGGWRKKAESEPEPRETLFPKGWYGCENCD
jgi:hypothetical protein